MTEKEIENKVCIVIGIIILGISCSDCRNHKNIKSEVPLIVCIDDIRETQMRLSELVDSCKFVQLDNNPVALLNLPSHFAVSDSFILITDALDKPAKLFSISGRFMRNLGSIGKGLVNIFRLSRLTLMKKAIIFG